VIPARRVLAPMLSLAISVLTGCATTAKVETELVHARVTADYATYRVERVGLLPFRGEVRDAEQQRALQAAFARSLAHHARFEVVVLAAEDLEEVPESEPLRRGWVRPETVLSLGRRYALDGLLCGTIAEAQSFTPLKLALQVDLVATETGLPIWSASTSLDGGEEQVRSAVQAWHDEQRNQESGGEPWDLSLVSPRRFAEFAVEEIARALSTSIQQ
jgi:hypothetical protein